MFLCFILNASSILEDKKSVVSAVCLISHLHYTWVCLSIQGTNSLRKKNKCGPLKYMEFHLFARLKNVMFYDMALKHTGRTNPKPVKSETSENMSKVRQFEHSTQCWNCFYEEGSHLFQRIPRISDWDLAVSCSQPKILRGLGWAMSTRTEHIANSGF